MKTALIAGPTGLTGKKCLEYLLESGQYSMVTVLTRKKLNIENKKLVQIITDFNDLQESLKQVKVNDVYCCLGTTMKKAGSKEAFFKVDFDYPLQIASFLKQNGASTFNLVSAIGANKNSTIFYSKVKGEIEQALIKLHFPKLNILRPSILDGERKESRPGEKAGLILSKIVAPLMIGPLKKYKPVKACAVAFALIYFSINAPEGVNIIESDKINSIYNKEKYGIN
ncbi:MAG: oxidoreductase [Bacteroidetes bacterium]|nr:oxidoreductase [Bacteroidota bacterium]HET6245878.1 oxidoreductase [Bacteroidia bacterium]